MSIGTRIKKTRLILGLTQKEIANKLNVSPQAFSAWERETSKPAGEFAAKLADVLLVDHKWLLFGEESRNSDKVISFKESVKYVRFYSDICAAAGCGIENHHSDIEYYPIPEFVLNQQKNRQQIYCISCVGDSMEPVFHHGSILAVNPEEKIIYDGRIYIIRCNGSLRVKILRETYEGIVIKSYNNNYPDELIQPNDLDFEILGNVFWFSSTLNN